MATNNFQVFDANKNNIMPTEEYKNSNVRLNGVTSGIADSKLHNRIFRQSSIMAAAIGQVLADNNVNASDEDLAVLVAAIKNVFNIGGGPTGTLPVSSGGTGNTSFAQNSILTGNGTNALIAKLTGPGALYATAVNGPLFFGTLPVAQGGTGNTSVDTTPTASSTKMVTSGGVKTALDSKVNRTDNVNAANTNYSSYMARAIAAGTTDMVAGTTPLTSGAIYIYYEE